MHAKSGLRVFLKWKIYRPDSVIADVIMLTEMIKFSLKTTFFMFIAMSLALCAWQINTLHEQLSKDSKRLEYLESRRRIVDLTLQLVSSFDMSEQSEVEEFNQVRWMLGKIPQSRLIADDSETRELFRKLLFQTQVELHEIDSSNQLELLSMHWDSHSVPGTVTTVLAVFKNGRFVDRIVRDESTRIEGSHDIIVVDFNRDGNVDVGIDIQNGCWGPGDTRVEYEISDSGFTPMEGSDAG